jgi:hypothetical protein
MTTQPHNPPPTGGPHRHAHRYRLRQPHPRGHKHTRVSSVGVWGYGLER